MKRILAIAINDYDDTAVSNLKNCVSDMSNIVSVLSTKYDFDDVDLLSEREQTTREFLHDYLHNYFVNALPEDQILLLFAGHGEYDPKLQSSYWLPSDAKASQKHTWLNLNELIDLLRSTEALHVNIISDSCFSGAIFEIASRGGGATSLENKKSRLALTSGDLW